MCTVYEGACVDQRHQSPGAGVTRSCELPDLVVRVVLRSFTRGILDLSHWAIFVALSYNF